MKLGSFLGNDTKFGRLMTKCGTIFAINILFVLTCIPFVTAGAGFAAMYHAVFEVIRADMAKEERLPVNPFKAYWEGLKRHFLRATLCWLTLAAVMAAGYIDLKICAQAGGAFRFLSAGVIAVLIGVLIIAVYLFPVMTQTGGKLADQVKYSIYAAMSSLPKLLLVLALNGFMPLMLYLDEVNRPTYAFAGTFFAFGLGAFIVGRMLFPILSGDSESFSVSRAAG